MIAKTLTVSIVIPVYNEERYIGPCLEAISKQTVKPLEVIVVDNNSTDKTLEVVKKYKFVKLLNEKKQGVVYARNKGFNSAKGDIIGRIDADTILPKNWVNEVTKILSLKSIDAVTGPVNYYDMPLPTKNYWIDHTARKLLYERTPSAPFFFGSNSAFKANAWREIARNICTDGMEHEDLDIAIHLKRAGKKIVHTKQILASASSRRYDDSVKQFKDYMDSYINVYKKHGITSKGPIIAVGLYWAGYFIFQPFRFLYDEEKRKFRLKHIFKGKNKARKHPMSS